MEKILIPWLAFFVLFVWVSARGEEWNLIIRLNPAADDIIPADAKIEKLAGDFGHPEGPV